MQKIIRSLCHPALVAGATRFVGHFITRFRNECVVTFLLFLFVFYSSFSYAAVLKLPTVTVMADHNLSLAVAEIARNYSRYNQVVVNTSFAQQEVQQTQINEGSAADILITAREDWIDELKQQGLIDIYSQYKLAGDKLVLVGSATADIPMPQDKKFPTVAIINSSRDKEPVLMLGNPETLMDGAYAKEALRNLGVSDDLEPYTLYVKNAEDILEAVGEKQLFAICFYSLVFNRSELKILYQIPSSMHKEISYNAVVIAGDNMDEARKFLAYLKTDEVKEILKKNGLNN